MVRYFRPSDYYYMAGSTLAFPGALWLMESASPARGKGHFRKGKALAALQRYEEARAAFELGHQCEPDNEDFLQAIAALP